VSQALIRIAASLVRGIPQLSDNPDDWPKRTPRSLIARIQAAHEWLRRLGIELKSESDSLRERVVKLEAVADAAMKLEFIPIGDSFGIRGWSDMHSALRAAGYVAIEAHDNGVPMGGPG
jgi:hypothetical protein